MNERSVFVAALDLDNPAERAAYLDRACGGNPVLRQRVEHLLATFERAGDFLKASAPGLNPNVTIDEPPLAERPGATVGAYKLMEQIGEGGFGLVFVAEQQRPVRRRVALKIIKPGLDSAQVIARFEAERQALAMMDHQNIAKVYDAGTTDSGRPYFVMELVHGTPLTEYCDANKLTPRQRLHLFVPVCHAIQHAHQKGIIHRDLKPSNILVTMYDDKPVPKVIDFGVAKAIEQRLTEKTVYTQFGMLVGTFEYMSPEQAEMNAFGVDTRSDIYSLGVLLYELLTGTTPLERARLRKEAFDEIRRIIKEEEPQRPSIRLSTSETRVKVAAARQTDPAKLSKLMRGELDWVVMKCLEKDRSRRYETANGLARDVERYLRDEPVEARPPSPWYRFGKLARRNKRALLTAAVVGVMLLVSVGAVAGSVGWMMRDWETRRMRVAGQIDLNLAEVEQLQKEQKWAEALLAAQRAEVLLTGADIDERLHERVRQVLSDLELVQRLEAIRLERMEHAEEGILKWVDRKLSSEFRDAGVNLDAIGTEEAVRRLGSREAVKPALAVSLDGWALSRLQSKNTAGARTLWAVADRLDDDPWRRKLRAQVSQFDIDRLVVSRRGALTLPEAEAAQTLDALQRLIDSPDFVRQPPFALFHLGMTLSDCLEKPDLATAVLRRAHSRYPGDFFINAGLADCLSKQGPEYQNDAIAFFQATVALRPNVAWGWARIGNIRQFEQKRMDEANAAYRKALELEPKNAWVHNLVGWGFAAQKKLDEATRHYEKAIEIDATFAAAYTNLGILLRDQKKHDDSIAAILKAIDVEPKDSRSRYHLGLTLLAQHLAVRDDKILDEAVAAMTKAVELAPNVSGFHWGLGRAFDRQKKLDKAVACFRRGIELDPKDADCHWGLGDTLRAQKKPEEAVLAYRKAVDLRPDHAHSQYGLARALTESKKPDDAIADYRKLADLNPKNVGARVQLGNLLQQQGQVREAIDCFRQAIELDPNSAAAHQHLALHLATAPHPGLRDMTAALLHARKALELNVDNPMNWRNLGIALLRTGEAKAALEALEKVDKVATGPFDNHRFVLAMAYWQSGDKAKARRAYDQGAKWMDETRSNDRLQRGFQAEAAEMLKISDKPQ